jgi:transcriptional regulator with GAF, ATPase, and Fis domain
VSQRIGRFEAARSGTIFLDEIGDMSPPLQAKLLRITQEGTFNRVGSGVVLHTDARIIAATNRVLEEEVKNGRFREDLFYRLNVVEINIPPLRERPKTSSHWLRVLSLNSPRQSAVHRCGRDLSHGLRVAG